MERAAGGTSQRMNPGLAIERLRSRKDNAPIAHTSFVKWPCFTNAASRAFHWTGCKFPEGVLEHSRYRIPRTDTRAWPNINSSQHDTSSAFRHLGKRSAICKAGSTIT